MKNDQKSIFELGKILKLPEMQFHEKKFDVIDFTSFLTTRKLVLRGHKPLFVPFSSSTFVKSAEGNKSGEGEFFSIFG